MVPRVILAGHPRPPAAVNARSERLVALQPPPARAMSTDEPAGTAEPVEPAGHRKAPKVTYNMEI